MRSLFVVEARRDLSRRVVRVLILLALALTLIAGVVAFVQTPSDFRPETRDAAHVAVLTDLRQSDGEDAILYITSFFLGVGAMIGGASVIGAEWRFQTMATLLTWETRRARVALVKIGVAAALAAVIAVALQLVFSLALLPTSMVKGTTAGADAEWVRGYAGLLLRSGALTGLAAAAAASVAMIGRNTAAALGAAFAYFSFIEQVIRAWRPGLRRWLIGENIGTFLSGHDLRTFTFRRSTLVAGLTLLLYVAVLAALATWIFKRRDVASAG